MVGLTIYFKTSLVRNSDNIKYKTQNPCNENQGLKSTDLRQTQRFIESWSISTALVPYSLRFSQFHWYYNSNIISKLYCTYRNHVVIPKQKTCTQTHTNTQTKKKQQQHIIASVYIIGGDAIMQLLWIINRKGLHCLPYCHHS